MPTTNSTITAIPHTRTHATATTDHVTVLQETAETHMQYTCDQKIYYC